MVNEKSTKERPPLIMRWGFLVLLILFGVLIIFWLLKPLRIYSAKKYISEGDKFLADKAFLHADLSYEKALILAPGHKDAKTKKALANDSSQDVTILKNFYESNKLEAQKSKLSSAIAFPKDETEAVKLSKKLIEEKEYQLAILPAKTATEMSPEYRDAWLYLGIANLKTAQFVELKPEIREDYLSKAKKALEKATQIDPDSKAVNDYLNEII